MNDHKLREEIENLMEFDTALLANTLGYVDSTPAHDYYMSGDIRSVTPSLGPTVGMAVTCEMDSSSPGNTADMAGYWEQLEQIKAINVPTVWVVKCIGSRPEHECVIGDGMAKMLGSVGCVGVVTDGGVRDLAGLLSVPMATYARGFTIHHTALRVSGLNKPIEIGGITVTTGDIIHANSEGVIKLPRTKLDLLSTEAGKMRLFEYEAHQIFRNSSLSLSEKQKMMGPLIEKFDFTDCTTKR